MNNELLKRVITSIVITFLSFYCIIKGTYLFDLFILSILSLSLFEWNSLSNKIIYFIIGSLFLIFAFFFAYQLRNINLSFFLFTIIISISSDIGGYVCGKIFKGPKLTKISPNKTFSGCIGSFFFFNSYRTIIFKIY